MYTDEYQCLSCVGIGVNQDIQSDTDAHKYVDELRNRNKNKLTVEPPNRPLNG